VKAAQVGCERLDLIVPGVYPGGLGQSRFGRQNQTESTCRGGWLDRGGHEDERSSGFRGRRRVDHRSLLRVQQAHHRSKRWLLAGLERGRHLGRLSRREVEVSRQDLRHVLFGQHLGQFGGGGQAEPAVAQGLDDLREALEQTSGAEAPEGGAAGELELHVEEGEERGMAERLPPTAPVEVGQRNEELGHGGLLPAKEHLERITELPRFQEFEGGAGRSVSVSVSESRGRGRGRVRVVDHSRIVSCGSDISDPAKAKETQEGRLFGTSQDIADSWLHGRLGFRR
jgi:hypothetical protein